MQLFDGALTLTLPKGWDEQTVYTFVAPEKPALSLPTAAKVRGFRPNILVARGVLPEGTSLEAMAQAQLEMSRRELPGFRLLAESHGTRGGQPSVEWTVSFSATPDGVIQVRQRQVFVLAKEGAFYALTAAGLPNDNETFAEFEAVLAGLRLG